MDFASVPLTFCGTHPQQRSFSTDGKFPAFAFRLLIMKNIEVFLKYYMTESQNSKPELITFSGQHSAIHSLLPNRQLFSEQAAILFLLITRSFVSCGLVFSHFSPHPSRSSCFQESYMAPSPTLSAFCSLHSAQLPPGGPNSH